MRRIAVAALALWAAASAGVARGFVPIDDFEKEQLFTLGARSAGTAAAESDQGLGGSRGLVFRCAPPVGRVSASWSIAFDPNLGFVLWAREISGQAAINIRLIESDGDSWSAWVAPKDQWRQFGLPLGDFEFIRGGNGVRQPASIQRLELEAVLRGSEPEKRCVVDGLGTDSQNVAASLRFQPEYLGALFQAGRAIPLAQSNALNLMIQQLQRKPAPSQADRLRILKEGCVGLFNEAEARARELSGPGPAGDAAPANSQQIKAALDRREAQAYRQRVNELSRRFREYDLRFDEVEEGLLYSRRMLERLQAAAKELESGNPGIGEPVSEAVRGSANPTFGRGLAMGGLAATPARSSILLNGPWEFAGGGQGPPTSGWTTLPVPHGFWSQTLGTNFSSGPSVGPGLSSAWLRRRVYAPSEWAGARTALSFRGAGHSVEAWVNGTYCGFHIGGFEPFDIDVSRAIRPGEANDIYLFISNSTSTAAGALDPLVGQGVYPGVKPGPGPNFHLAMNGAEAANAGIWDDVSLECAPKLSIRAAAIQTSVRENLLKVRLETSNETAERQAFRVEAAVVDGAKTLLEMTPADGTLEPNESREISLSQRWTNYEPWGPAPPYGNPRLYQLRLRLSRGGTTVDERWERFGFREFEIAYTGFVLNGRPIRLQADRLSASEGGKTWERANPWYFARYLRLARAANVNCVVLDSETPQSWLDVCDEMGMLCVPASPIQGLVCRAPLDLFGLDDYHDPLWLQNGQRQMAAWARGHLNHPSVVARVTESGSFGEDVFWAHGGGIPSQARKTRERLEAAFAFDDAVRRTDSSLPILHLDTGYADADPRFAVCGRLAPFPPEDWRRTSLGRPLVAEIREPRGNPAVPREDDLRQTDREAAGRSLDRLAQWMGGVIGELRKSQVPAIVLPGLQAGIYSTARRDLMGPWFALTGERLASYPQEQRAGGTPLARVNNSIRPLWPSLSGPGIRVEAFDLADGLSTWINWFEPKTPVATPNPLYVAVREAFESAPALAEPQRAEAIVQLAGGQESAGKTVFLTPTDGLGGPIQGVLADDRGRAWFVLPQPGRYRLALGGAPGTGETIDVPPSPPNPQPGFWHIPVVKTGLR